MGFHWFWANTDWLHIHKRISNFNLVKFWSIWILFLLLGSNKVHFIAPYRENKSIFVLEGHKVHFITLSEANSSIFWPPPPQKKKKPCTTRKKIGVKRSLYASIAYKIIWIWDNSKFFFYERLLFFLKMFFAFCKMLLGNLHENFLSWEVPSLILSTLNLPRTEDDVWDLGSLSKRIEDEEASLLVLILGVSSKRIEDEKASLLVLILGISSKRIEDEEASLLV